MKISIIAGVAQNGVIGNKGDLPWHISEDLKRFKELTMGKPVIMGRKTHESIVKVLGEPLPGRTNIVVSKTINWYDGVIIANSIDEAIEKAGEFGDKAFVIGGQNIYEQTLHLADELEITHVHKDFEGDAHFPKIDEEKWRMVLKEDKKTRDGELQYSFVTYQKKEQGKKKGKGLFIVFEGIDGSGKSTQVKKFMHYLFDKDKHHNLSITRNPYKDTDIRKILREDSNPYEQAEKLADLFINDRKKQTEEIIKPNLEKGNIVISDRYKMSTITYQAAQGVDMQKLIEKHETSDFIVPDMVFIIDVSAEEAAKRMHNEETRELEHKFEADLGFARKLRENHHEAKEILERKGENIFLIDGQKSPEEVFEEIKGIYERETK